jgi:hypothetical protein
MSSFAGVYVRTGDAVHRGDLVADDGHLGRFPAATGYESSQGRQERRGQESIERVPAHGISSS